MYLIFYPAKATLSAYVSRADSIFYINFAKSFIPFWQNQCFCCFIGCSTINKTGRTQETNKPYKIGMSEQKMLKIMGKGYNKSN